MMFNDKYTNYETLSRSEKLGFDYEIRIIRKPVSVAIIAPHGGKIEPGTSEIAEGVAGENYNLYCFEGRKPHSYRDLHITSTNFDEPGCCELISKCDVVVAIHGCADGDESKIFVGGLDGMLRGAIYESLKANGFDPETHYRYLAENPSNICNQGRARKGVQLEISQTIRDMILDAAPLNDPYPRLIEAVRNGIQMTKARTRRLILS